MENTVENTEIAQKYCKIVDNKSFRNKFFEILMDDDTNTIQIIHDKNGSLKFFLSYLIGILMAERTVSM